MKYLVLTAFASSLQTVRAVLSEASYMTNPDRPLIFAHRGSSGPFPEQSLPAISAGYYSGADFLEIDVLVTKDLHIVCMHDREMSFVTDALDYSDVYADRLKDGEFYVEDFSLAEIKTFKQKQAGSRSKTYDGLFDFVTLQEVFDSIRMWNEENPRILNADNPFGVMIEIKGWPEIEQNLNIDVAEMIYNLLDANNLGTIAAC